MIWIYDIETLSNCFVVCFKNTHNNEKKHFIIWKNRNDRNVLLDFIKKECNILVGFNNINFDAQIIKYLTDKPLNANQLYLKAQNLISSESKYPPFNEKDFIVKNLDLLKVWHYDNEARRTSLKWIQFSMNWHNLEEMPFEHDHEVETIDELDAIISYCYNDIESTHELYKITIGQTDNPLYKGINKLSLRGDIYEEFKLDCFNYNDVKIGEEIIKKSYLEETGLTFQQVKEIPKSTKTFTFGDCFPSYTKFESKVFNDFIDSIRNVVVTQDEKQSFNFKVNYLSLTIAKGGLHSEDNPRLFISNNRFLLRDADVGSMYPNGIRKRRLYPSHLGEQWLSVYSYVIEKRLNAKALFKQTKEGKYKAIDEAFKLALNGGSFGKTGESFNWQYDLFTMNRVTIGCQIDLLMFIEQLMLNGIYIVSANTDGVLCYLDREKENIYNKICKDWEIIVGNDTMGNLEYQDFNLFAQTSVNDYLAIKPDGKLKTKGDFVSDIELHKNRSRRIVALALQNHFKNNIPVEETIRNHKDIFDFCCAVRVNRGDDLYIRNIRTGKEYKEQRTVRYYISNSNDVLLKRMKPLNKTKPTFQLDIFGNIEDGTRQSQIEAGWNITVFNKFLEKDNYNINYDYYIERTHRILDQIEKVEFNQISL